MEKRDRFLLEDMIMQCWHVTGDINTVADYIGESADIPAKEKDKLLNMLIGMRELYNIKFSGMFNLFEELIEKGNIK